MTRAWVCPRSCARQPDTDAATQHQQPALLERAAWDAGAAMAAVREFAVARLGGPGGAVLVLDLCRSRSYAEARAA